MDSNFITPLVSVQKSNEQFMGATRAPQEAAIPFADIFQKAVANTYDTDQALQQEALAAATGEVDQLHDLTIASTKADMALKLFVQLRNKGHDAYSEIMRMGV